MIRRHWRVSTTHKLNVFLALAVVLLMALAALAVAAKDAAENSKRVPRQAHTAVRDVSK